MAKPFFRFVSATINKNTHDDVLEYILNLTITHDNEREIIIYPPQALETNTCFNPWTFKLYREDYVVRLSTAQDSPIICRKSILKSGVFLSPTVPKTFTFNLTPLLTNLPKGIYKMTAVYVLDGITVTLPEMTFSL